MTNFKRALMFLGVALLCGCAEPPPQESVEDEANHTTVLGFSQLGDESAWRTHNTESITNEAHKHGIRLMFSDAEQKQENQIKAIRSFIAYQADVIAFSPIVETGWDDVLKEAKEAGIPVILTDRHIKTDDQSLFTCYIGADFNAEGQAAARYLLKKFNNSAEPVRIMEIYGTEDSSPARGRAEGFREGLKDYPDFKIVKSVNGDFMRSKGREIMSNELDTIKEYDVVFSHNDAMTLGALEAMDQIDPGLAQSLVVISFDGEQEAIEALKAGKINCVVECNPDLGAGIMSLTEKLVSGQQTAKMNYTNETVFTEWSDLAALPPRGY